MKDAIPKLHVTIKHHINFESLIPYFNKYKMFTRDEMEDFTSIHLSYSKRVNSLIEWLPKKDDIGIYKFVRVLKEAEEHSGHLEIIKHLHACTIGTLV